MPVYTAKDGSLVPVLDSLNLKLVISTTGTNFACGIDIAYTRIVFVAGAAFIIRTALKL